MALENKVENRVSLDAFLSIGFRPFFLGASVFAVVTMFLWASIYFFNVTISTAPITVLQWHAHEMIYGYSMAVIGGFLLTAVTNWTSLPTATGKHLLLIFSCWCIARILYFFGSQFVLLAALFDIAFGLLLLVAITGPIIKKKLWKRFVVVSKLILLVIFQALFVLVATGVLNENAHQYAQVSIYAGLYLIIGLILTIGRNLVPFFIQRGVDYDVSIENFRFLDISSLILFLVFFVLELSSYSPQASAYAASGLFIVNIARLTQWHTPGIWQKPLLWGLYLSYCFVCLGFLLFALHYVIGVSKYLAIHAFAVGGIGLVTLSMICRVATGHTGRNIAQPPKLVKMALSAFVLGAIIRVVLPLFWPVYYSQWVAGSMFFWLLAFLIYIYSFSFILLTPRLPEKV